MRNLTDAEVAARLAKKAAAGQAVVEAVGDYLNTNGHNADAWQKVRAALDAWHALEQAEGELVLTE